MDKIKAVKTLMDILRFLQKYTPVLTPLLALTLVLSGIFELATVGARPEEVAKTMVLGADSWEHSQDITTDGESYYFSCKYGIIKTELDCKKVIVRNADAIPDDFKAEYGSAHIGGISFYNGKLYCAVEDSKVFEHPLIVVYDAETLEYTGEYYHLDAEKHTKGLPWISVNPETGIIYCAARDNSTEIMCYDTAAGKYLEPIALVNSDPDFNIHKIQGGEVNGGVLYLATNDSTQALYTVDLASGQADKLFDRNLFEGSEGEGLTVLKTEDGAFIHAMDMSPIFISAYVRHYAY
ncbi:MAG: hypothetical protein IKC20_06810 [Clostridia bacterium]|nr:hypothetical protein [Clostridia bacterium]MBR4049337.1 hypothetical protein [Clostridia bacterium]